MLFWCCLKYFYWSPTHDDVMWRSETWRWKTSLPSWGPIVNGLSLISVSQNVQLRWLEENVQPHLHRVCGSLYYHAPGDPPLLVGFKYNFFFASLTGCSFDSSPWMEFCWKDECCCKEPGIELLSLFPGSFTPRWCTPWPSTNPSLGSTSSMGWCVCSRFCRSSGLRSSCEWLSNSYQAMYKAPLFLSPSNVYHENSPCANNVFFIVSFRGRTLSKMSVVTKRRPSQTMKAKNWGKNPKMATCRMATSPLTTTTGKGSDRTLVGCVMTGTMVWPLT